ncbi:MAG: lysophospholipid acyltransferase family protein [Nocardioides sp.]
MTSYDGLPRIDAIAHPSTGALTRLRPAALRLLKSYYDLRTHHADRVPLAGPVIMAPNHVGWWDGPLLATVSPRPVHALTKQEMFRGPMGPFLRWAGQISLDRRNPDPGAVKACLRVLTEGGAAGIFPEGTRGDGELSRINRGAAYLALVSGAPVVPVQFFGTRLPGAGSRSRPPRGTRVDVSFGMPWRTAARPWPRTKSVVEDSTEALRQHLVRCLDNAKAETRLNLPGPLPEGDKEAALAKEQDVL